MQFSELSSILPSDCLLTLCAELAATDNSKGGLNSKSVSGDGFLLQELTV